MRSARGGAGASTSKPPLPSSPCRLREVRVPSAEVGALASWTLVPGQGGTGVVAKLRHLRPSRFHRQAALASWAYRTGTLRHRMNDARGLGHYAGQHVGRLGRQGSGSSSARRGSSRTIASDGLLLARDVQPSQGGGQIAGPVHGARQPDQRRARAHPRAADPRRLPRGPCTTATGTSTAWTTSYVCASSRRKRHASKPHDRNGL